MVERIDLFERLMGGDQKRLRHRESKRLGSLEIDDKLELGRLHNRQLRGFLAFEDTSNVGAGLTRGFG